MSHATLVTTPMCPSSRYWGSPVVASTTSAAEKPVASARCGIVKVVTKVRTHRDQNSSQEASSASLSMMAAGGQKRPT